MLIGQNRLCGGILLFSALALLHVCKEEGTSEATLHVATNGEPFPWTKIRLPETVKPLYYDLIVHPNLTSLDFTGAVQIHVDVLEETKAVIVHSKKLNISNAGLVESGNVRALRVLEFPAYEQVALLSDDVALTRGSHVVLIEFSAKLSDSFHGFYKSTYRTRDGENRVLASTQFEPTHARAAFPCFDEPAFKANFSIRIRREPRHIAVSNMPKLRTEAIASGLLEDQFDVSVRMSTYLVAFIVGDFLSVSTTSQHGVQISVYTVPEKISQAEYALDTAAKLLDFYDDYFNIPYPLPKQDLAAIPNFQSGAMENWGLTTYREAGLLFDPEKSSTSDKLGITKVIAHEMAHQWFGNLVTMEWWNDLWLNEGFAKFMEFVSVNITHPELQVEDYFLQKCFAAMETDALSSSHPVSTAVENPAEISQMFDDVSYDKGACILNMLRDFLTAEVFKMGIIRYLRRYSYQNTVSDHLWESLTSICPSDTVEEGRFKRERHCSGNIPRDTASKWFMEDNLDVKAIMDTWTLQEGFPVITVEVRGREVRLSQERYLKGGDPSRESSFLWQVPLTYITSSSSYVHHYLLKTKTDVLYLPEEVDWIKFNVDMRGYYIVHYEAGGWDALSSLLRHNHSALSSNDRASLIHNIFLSVSMGKVPLDRALDLSLYLSQETEIMPVTQGLAELVTLYKLMEKRDMEKVENQMKGFLVHVFRGLIERQSWSDEGSVSQRMLRSHLLLFACLRRHRPCVDAASRLFRRWSESGGNMSLPRDVSLVVFAVGAQTPQGWDFLLERYRHSLFSSEKSRIKSALAISPLSHKLQWMMEQSLEGSMLKTQDLPHIVILISRNPKGYQLAWDFLRANWDRLLKKFDLGSSSISRMVTGVTDQYSTREKLEEVRRFFGSLTEETGAGLRCIQKALETIEENVRWMDKNMPFLEAWLDRQQSLGEGWEDPGYPSP